MRHLQDFAQWYGKEYLYGGKVPAEKDPMTYRALYVAPELAKSVTKELRDWVAGEGTFKSVATRELSGIQGLTTLLFLYLIGAVEATDASAGGYGTEKNFTHMLSKTALSEAVVHNFTVTEQYVWKKYRDKAKELVLAALNSYLARERPQPGAVTGGSKVINWYWTSPEKPEHRSVPELWNASEQKSFVTTTVDEVFADTSGPKDRLLMRLYQIPTTSAGTYAAEGPIPLDRDRHLKAPLNVVEFRTVPGSHPPEEWLPLAMTFFRKGQEIHAREKA
jgi:hypothetical protein